MYRVIRILLVSQAIVGVASIRLCAQTSQPVTPLERVLAKYPSREALQTRVDQFKAAHAGEFHAAASDFDLAIRSINGLDFPVVTDVPDGPMPHVSPRPDRLKLIDSRQKWLDLIARCRAKGTQNAIERASFYEQHLDDLTFEANDAFRMVALDILVRGWHDWSHWSEPKLEQIRERVPDIHAYYALREMMPLKSLEARGLARDVLGILLQALLAPNHSAEFLNEADRVVRYSVVFEPDEDVLLLCLSELLDHPDGSTDIHFLSIASAIDDRLPRHRRCELWLDYLDAPISIVREMAVEGIGSSIRKPRSGEPPRPEDAELADRLRQIAQSDPSKGVRRMAATLVREYDTSDVRPTHGRGGGPNSQ